MLGGRTKRALNRGLSPAHTPRHGAVVFNLHGAFNDETMQTILDAQKKNSVSHDRPPLILNLLFTMGSDNIPAGNWYFRYFLQGSRDMAKRKGPKQKLNELRIDL
ncbi:hypothetical protein CDAR_520061 [Caerostris darwini]|uniref:Uncharacterized protein n=1 Tax=Caerostris darwini TaxID=1538125 RepID=A0AAV4R1R5_9ARAC|nr:hypothetical protein CDAR_520061 [Caerostris darwini]